MPHGGAPPASDRNRATVQPCPAHTFHRRIAQENVMKTDNVSAHRQTENEDSVLTGAGLSMRKTNI